jgi:hypothetical protein
MDPFVVISFGKKVFSTRIIRHSFNPVWDEKLLFHVRRYETTFNSLSSTGTNFPRTIIWEMPVLA